MQREVKRSQLTIKVTSEWPRFEVRIGNHTVTFGQEVGSGRQSVMGDAPG